jgi:lysophospholipase L1-like esterase
VRSVGRTTPGTMMGERFAWSGTSFSARFTGTQIVMRMSDASRNEFAVVVDGSVTRVATNMGVTRYQLATGLAEGEHEVTVWRRTEARQGPSEFIAFTELSDGGAFLAPPPRAERRIEIIGDSITAGLGIAGTAPCDNVRSNDDNYSAYGSVAARAVRAELVTIAWSDIGMYRNKDQTEASADAMPARYAKILPNDATAPNWDFTRYYPDAVVINLGTNDFDQGDPGQGFVDAYIEFLSAVRRNYSSAYIFCLIQAPESAAAITAAADARKAAGDGFVESYDINVTQGGNTACSLQADIPRHAAMGARLAQRLRIRLGW